MFFRKIIQKIHTYLQRGILQEAVCVTVGVLCILPMGLAFYFIGKYDVFSNSNSPAIDIVGVAVVFSLITAALLSDSRRVNLSWRVVLPQAVEFSSAMRKLGLLDFDTQLAFVASQKMNLYIAERPILNECQAQVTARYYKFFAHKKILSSHKGSNRLCLDAKEHEAVILSLQTPFSVFESAKLDEKNAIITALQNELLMEKAKGENLAVEIAEINNKFAILEGGCKTESGRSEANSNLHASRAPFWLVAAPLIEQLRQEADKDTEYSQGEVQAAFERELENHPVLKPPIMALLRTTTKEKNRTPFSLDGWGMEGIRHALKIYEITIKSKPGPKSSK